MVTITSVVPALSPETVSLYYTEDALLQNLPVLVFYGPSTTANSTLNSSRIQAHVYSLAGFQSFARLTVAPTSPVYAAVHHLPTEKQGDEICRGLAVGLLSYFADIPKSTKEVIRELVARRRPNGLAPAMFDEMHAGDLAAKMVKVDQPKEAIAYLMAALAPQVVSWIDVDVVLPQGTIERSMSGELGDQEPSVGDDGLPLYQYGPYTSLINSLGSPTFLPTSKLKRAPSRPTVNSKNKLLTKEQKISLRREMCELLDTEKRYIDKLGEVVHSIAKDFSVNNRDFGAVDIVRKLFPDSLDGILTANTAFHDEIEKVLEETEDEAIQDIEIEPTSHISSLTSKSRKRDPTGATAFAKTLLQWLPKFTLPYQEYMRSSAELSTTLSGAHQMDPSLSAQIQEMGEQRLRSALIEPVQRLPRYSLLIDNMVALLPSSHPAMSSLLKAKDVITEICALDHGGSTDSNRAVACLRSLVEKWPADLSPHGRLVLAVDIAELDPPYSDISSGQAGILLLFPETCVLLHKRDISALSARGIVAEVERPIMRSDNPGDRTGGNLVFSCALPLSELHVSHSENGHIMWLGCSDSTLLDKSASASPAISKVIALLSSYEGKAVRLSEEIGKSRIEGRHHESLRESDKWTLRAIDPLSQNLGLLAAIFENGPPDDSRSRIPSNVRINIGAPTSTKLILAASESINIAVSVNSLGNDAYRVDCRHVDGHAFTDTANVQEIPKLLLRICKYIRL